jgi:2-polyprenyl-3-methyl-5-hydroxy-6-metoxy-1,4-benzoquinol methylase
VSTVAAGGRENEGVRLPTNAEAIATWSRVPQESPAAFDPDGDTARRVLLDPHIFRLLGDVTGATVLDAGCGQGYLARLLAGRGARVTGVEPAQAPYEYAVARERERRQQIRYLQADLAGAGGLDGQFDAVVANVVLEAIPDWVPALRTCVRALRPGGLLVFSLEHPCFEDGTRSWHQHGCVEVREYLHDYARPSPPGTDFHRPLSAYLNQVIRAGATLTEITEPTVPPGHEAATGPAALHVPNFIIVAARQP